MRSAGLAAVVLAAALTAAGCAGTGRQPGATTTSAPTETVTTTAAAPAPSGPAAGFADVVERLSPSVVTVRQGDGVGSGVVLRPDVIVTNAHVVGDAENVLLVFADGEEARGRVLATDEITDLAVIRSERGDLPVPEFRTELPRPGEWAVAIGSPLGFQNSVSAGVISGLHRDIPGSGAQTQSLVDLIQTDAPISPGNSGGALLDMDGRVVGINEAYLPPSTGAVSLGFAIPAGTALDVAEQLLEHGRAIHPYLGVGLSPITPSLRRALRVRTEDGALITEVDRGAPAGQAGLRPGDVVVEFNGAPVRTVEDLLSGLRRTRPGDRVEVVYLRGSGRQATTVTVGER
ncbi:trypsin-like peptidase domain-containing protein [uncultured Mycolicibacterium sp.]|uniref:S1C family serine protease n=1 Tax=uncultured Mycolicibacterium sp. TaxID=2320817 RepID=UPI0026263293|nr:trypsin-like peptidase domain-containing protein [uncultured Mycolicibacterium sp.]